MKKKRKNRNPDLKQLEEEVSEIKGQLQAFTDHLVETRELAVTQSQSLPILIYQFKQLIAQQQAYRSELVEREEAISERQAAYEHAMREASRERELSRRYGEALEKLVQKNRSLESELVSKEERIRQLETELEAKEQIVKSVKTVLNIIRERAERRELPSDVVAELEKAGVKIK